MRNIGRSFITTVRRTIMITWLLLLVALLCRSTHGENGDENQTSNTEVDVTPDLIDATHLGSWTSHVASECASYSVSSKLQSSGKLEHTPEAYAEQNNLEAVVFPIDGKFILGSTVTFCCILPQGTSLIEMEIDGYNVTDTNITMINDQTYALTVLLNQQSKDTCTNVYCNVNKHGSSGTCAYIDNPPEDRNLQCETRDLKLAKCRWTVGNNIELGSTRKKYWLQGRECKDGFRGRCSIEITNITETKWSLMVESVFGKVELTDIADMTKRVHMFAPDNVAVSHVNARNVSLTWKWHKQHYTNLNITCQVNVSCGETHITSETLGDFAVVNNLIPNWTYNATVRCGISNNLWKWGDWSSSVSFHTKGDVPDPLDVWMQMKKKQVIITWKMPLNNQSHGHIIDYKVTWKKTTEPKQQNHIIASHSEQHVKLSLDTTEEYTVTVTARNQHGSSSPSTITIPCWKPDKTRVKPSWIIGSNNSFSLSWSASPNASCGYILDWCPTMGNCTVEWIKVPSNKTKSSISSENFKNGLRYTLSIYACTQWAPQLLKTWEGYVREKRIKDNLFKQIKLKRLGLDVVVSWIPVHLAEQPAFIQGYILYWSDNTNKFIYSVSTANPEATSLTATNLRSDSYTFTLKAQTAVGKCGTTEHSATLNVLITDDDLIKIITISLVTVSGLLLLLTVLCYRHWACIKRKVYPPIPKPVLMDKWLTSPVEHTCHPVYVDQFNYNETDVIDVPELHFKSGAPTNSFIGHEDVPFVNSQTLKGYYNQPLKKYTPPSLIIPTMAIPSPLELPASSFTSFIPNLSYNLIMQAGGQQSSSELQLQEGSSSEQSSGAYQPQIHTDNFTLNQTEDNPDKPLYCVSTYILLPSTPLK